MVQIGDHNRVSVAGFENVLPTNSTLFDQIPQKSSGSPNYFLLTSHHVPKNVKKNRVGEFFQMD